MKVAVLLVGEPRLADLAGKLFWSGIDPSKVQVDVFIHSWMQVTEDTGPTPEDFSFTSWNPKYLQVDSQDEVFEQFDMDWNETPVFRRIFGQMVSFAKAVDMLRPYEIEYQIVVKARIDSFFQANVINNIGRLINYEKQMFIRYVPNVIFAEGITHYEENVPILTDYSFAGLPSRMIQFGSNVSEWIRKCPERIERHKFNCHRLWNDLATYNSLNMIPLRNGAHVRLDAPQLETCVLRPGLLNYPVEEVTWDLAKVIEAEYCKN